MKEKFCTGFMTAKRHPIERDVPSPGFFEGALIGNGGLGVVINTRPDSVVLRFGHNNVWDVRLAENHIGKEWSVFSLCIKDEHSSA